LYASGRLRGQHLHRRKRQQRGGGGDDDDDDNNDAKNSNPSDKNKDKVLFFCVAGQNRSPALALAVLMLFGHSLDDMCRSLAETRPFVLENVGFQWQLVELEHMLKQQEEKDGDSGRRPGTNKKLKLANGDTMYLHGGGLPPQLWDGDDGRDGIIPTLPPAHQQELLQHQLQSHYPPGAGTVSPPDPTEVEVELLIPGLCTMEVSIPLRSTIAAVKDRLVDHANRYLLAFDKEENEEEEKKRNFGGQERTTIHPSVSTTTTTTTRISKSWVVLAMFGYDSMYDFPLEVEAIDLGVQIRRMKTMFHLTVRSGGGTAAGGDPVVEWTEKCRFALVILAVKKTTTTTMRPERSPSSDRNGGDGDEGDSVQVEEHPWTFFHEERPGAPATLLKNTPMTTNLRAWDFVTGQAFASEQPVVFSFSKDGPRDKRSFMQISTSANELQQFHEPGEGGILGMGANAIVHRVRLKPTSAEGWAVNDGEDNDIGINKNDDDNGDNDIAERNSDSKMVDLSTAPADQMWDAAVKRPFGLTKMLAFLEHSSEAGVAKRLRFANALNSDGRVLYFYGLGVGMSANAYNPQEYKWEVMLLARYEKQFSAYTLRRFMEDYVAVPDERTMSLERRVQLETFQESMSLISVKLLLVNLLNAFRDLTLMGVQAFDFNHLNNVLVSRDTQTVQLIDIDGAAKGSIQFPSEYILGPTPSLKTSTSGPGKRRSTAYHKPSLEVDLNTVLPTVVEQLIMGKGRGRAFVTNKKSEIFRSADPEIAKALIKEVVSENFFPPRTTNLRGGIESPDEIPNVDRVLAKVAEWFYASLMRLHPWDNWTNDVYDALRCIDHLPIA
jgi:hypothetical protein